MAAHYRQLLRLTRARAPSVDVHGVSLIAPKKVRMASSGNASPIAVAW